MPATEVPHKLGRWAEISAGLGLAVDRDSTQIYYADGQCDAERIALCSLSERGSERRVDCHWPLARATGSTGNDVRRSASHTSGTMGAS